MDLFPVKSSNLASVGYDHAEKVLVVHFTNGARFRYLDVPPEKYAGIHEAPSAGHYFHSEIRPHHRAEPVVEKKEPEE